MESNMKKFYYELCKHSESDLGHIAIHEWIENGIEMAEDFGDYHCICGQPIKELCYVKNIKNNNELIIGNVCIQNFMKNIEDITWFYKGLKFILKNKIPNKKFIQFLYGNSHLQENEYSFLISIRTKRKLSIKQQNWKDSILNKLKINMYKFKKIKNDI